MSETLKAMNVASLRVLLKQARHAGALGLTVALDDMEHVCAEIELSREAVRDASETLERCRTVLEQLIDPALLTAEAKRLRQVDVPRVLDELSQLLGVPAQPELVKKKGGIIVPFPGSRPS